MVKNGFIHKAFLPSTDYGNRENDDTGSSKVGRFFKNLFGNDEDEADRYSHVANRSDAVVTVHSQSNEDAERAADILEGSGAVDVYKRASEYDYSGNTDTSNTMNVGNDTDSLKVIKVDVQVGKREVETGDVRLRSRIVERPVEENLRLREERVTVERKPVDRPASTADLQNFKEGEIEMTEHAEVADVTKQARVVEEVKLSKDVNEREETVRETARDVEIDVENLEGNNINSKKNKKNNL